MKIIRVLIVFAAAIAELWAADDAPAPALYKSAAELADVLKKNTAATPDMATSAVVNQERYRVNIVHRGKGAGAIVHPAGTEVHYIIEGAATFVTGGTLRPASGGGRGNATIANGESRHVAKGDVLLIPAGTPHWYKDVEGSITYLEVRFDLAPAKQ
jgi:mannose-6-phosphate isomerase-like protein (cupin superfamily)